MDHRTVKPLFPVGQNEEPSYSTSSALFPAYQTASTSCHIDTDAGKDATNTEWLKNSSYTSHTAEKLKEFQKELEETIRAQTNERKSDAEVQVVSERVSKREHTSSGSQSEDEELGRKHKKEKHRKHKKKHKKDKKYEKDKGVNPNPSAPSEVLFSSKKIFIEEIPDLSPQNAYRLDRKADRNSWTYQSLYKEHVARYKRLGNSCLGLPKGVQISFSDHHKSAKHKSGDSRYFSKENRRLLKSTPAEVIIPKQDENLSLTGQFIEVSHKGVNSTEADVRERILDSATLQYVQGGGAVDSVQHQEGLTDAEKGITSKTADYNRQLRENPANISLWLEFTDYQDKLKHDTELVSEQNKDVDKHRSTFLAVLEKKIAIIEKALQANPGSIELQIRHLELKSETSDPPQINKELEKLLFVHPANTRLWRYYLTFNQSRLSMFTVGKVTKLYHKCFKALVSVLTRKVQTARLPDNLESDLVDIFVEYCLFLKNGGHKEKAVASMQALLEINLFCPPELQSYSFADKVSVFEGFWDSGVPRIGDPEAKGWRSWMETKGNTVSQISPTREYLDEAEDTIVAKNCGKNQTWLDIEELRDLHHWLPWQPDLAKDETEEDCEDLDRLVLFDDIAPALLSVSAAYHFKCILGFLTVLGVNLNNTKLLTDLRCCGCRKSEMYVNLRDVLLQESNQLGALDKPEMSDTVKNFLINLLSMLIKHLKDPEQTLLTLILLEFRFSDYYCGNDALSKTQVKDIKKFAKNLLKESHNRNNLAVWAAYINLERQIGKSKEVISILETALTMFSKESGKNSTTPSGLLSLYRMYAEVLLGIKPVIPIALWDRQIPPAESVLQTVLQALCCAINEDVFKVEKTSKISGTVLLKCRTKVKNMFEITIKQLLDDVASNSHLKVRYLELCQCSALFELCTSGIDSAISIFEKAASQVNEIQSSSLYDLEQEVLISGLRLVLYHMSTQSTPLHLLRSCLDKALERYPNNPVFLSLFADIEQRSRVTGRLHRTFERLTRDSVSPCPVIFAVSCELNFHKLLTDLSQSPGSSELGVPESGLVHRTRRLLERCLSTSQLQHCALLWRIYLRAEMLFGNPHKMKGVFYRGLQQCPWDKALYVDGVKLFGESDLQEIVDLMTEKEIRVQIPVEEVDLLLGNEHK